MLQRDFFLAAADSVLLTDLYQLTMAAGYVGEGVETTPAAFELFVRRFPPGYGYGVAMGLQQVVEYLQTLQFTPQHLLALQETGIFREAPERFWQVLAAARFQGDLWAVPEGTVFFPQEPILRVEAPLWLAQLVETYILTTINYQTLIATKAARMRDAAGDEAILLEFGTRRAFSPQGGLWAARAALAAGFNATSNVLAAVKLGRKPAGTMAHAFVMAMAALLGDEPQAFESFRRYFPQSALLIDTYDCLQGARTAAALMERSGELGGVRIDSGNLGDLARQVQAILPQGSPIFVSGDLDEEEIARLQQSQAPIAGFGVGTRLVTGVGINGVYKLVEVKGIPVAKASVAKATLPGRKQVFRLPEADYVGLATESFGDPETGLLRPILKQGELVAPLPSLEETAIHARTQVQALPDPIRCLRDPQAYPVYLTPALDELRRAATRP
jgi:nicotinate phosphoribosyltransferase